MSRATICPLRGCDPAPFTASDGTVIPLRKCSSFDLTLRGRDPGGLFPLEQLDFIKNVQTVFNNDQDNSVGLGIGNDLLYFESNEGKLIPAKGIKGRYVRLWSKGSTSDDQNHYTEVEVWGLK